MVLTAANRGSTSRLNRPARWPSSMSSQRRRKMPAASWRMIASAWRASWSTISRTRSLGALGWPRRNSTWAPTSARIASSGVAGGATAAPPAGHQVARHALKHCAVQLFLVAEVVVEERRVDLRRSTDLLDRRGVEPLAGEEPLGGIENLLPGGGRRGGGAGGGGHRPLINRLIKHDARPRGRAFDRGRWVGRQLPLELSR